MTSHMITTRGQVHACQRCHQTIMTGLAEGLLAHTDLTPLDKAGELAALLQGRWTYSLHNGELVYRDPIRIKGGSISGPVLAEHQCETRPGKVTT